jgi:cyclopropane-fatty-acyl-phospholipid synthase
VAVHSLLGHAHGGRVELDEGGRVTRFGPPDAHLRARVEVRDPRAYAWALRGSTGWGEGYIERLWDSTDLVALARIAVRGLPALDRWKRAAHPVLGRLQRAAAIVPRNTRVGARRHISAHYDLGNELFQSFLDERMLYSCAYFPTPEADIHAAQLAKLERICDRLELGPDDHLLEIGTGWGGLAIHAAATRGCRVTTTTISREQYDFARSRVAAEGLQDRVTVLDSDYRDLGGRFDKLVSIEMIEAVGWQYFPEFFEICGSLLRPDGLMFLQAIVIGDDLYELEKASRTFSNKHIFPGGCLPSPGIISRLVATATDMRTVWSEDISEHYARTLRSWRERFEAGWERLTGLGYDDRFRRLWRFYLATSEAGFSERRIRDLQLLFAKPGWEASGSLAGTDGRRDKRHAGPVDQVRVGGSLEDKGVGAGAG